MGQKGKRQKKISEYIGKITPRGVIEKGKTRKYCSVYDYGAVKLLSELVQKHLDRPLAKYFYSCMGCLVRGYLMHQKIEECKWAKKELTKLPKAQEKFNKIICTGGKYG
jgi:hypothetical protein